MSIRSTRGSTLHLYKVPERAASLVSDTTAFSVCWSSASADCGTPQSSPSPRGCRQHQGGPRTPARIGQSTRNAVACGAYRVAPPRPGGKARQACSPRCRRWAQGRVPGIPYDPERSQGRQRRGGCCPAPRGTASQTRHAATGGGPRRGAGVRRSCAAPPPSVLYAPRLTRPALGGRPALLGDPSVHCHDGPHVTSASLALEGLCVAACEGARRSGAAGGGPLCSPRVERQRRYGPLPPRREGAAPIVNIRRLVP